MWIVFREEFKSGFDKKIDLQGENYFLTFPPQIVFVEPGFGLLSENHACYTSQL